MNAPLGLVPAAYVYLRRGDAVLLQLRRNTGYMDGCWTAGAAGHLEHAETSVARALRELEEELGVQARAEDLTLSSVMQRTDRSDDPREQRIDWFFSCDTWNGTPIIREPQKCADLQWFLLDELPASVPPYERSALAWLVAHDTVA